MDNNEANHIELKEQIDELKKQNEILRIQSLVLNEKEYYFNSILNNIGDPVFVKDEQSRLIYVNDAFSSIFNLTRKDIIGKTLAEDVTPEEQEIFLRIDKQVLNDGIENINEETLTIRGGKTRIISTRKTRLIDADGKKYLIGVIHDISDRKKTEISLKKSEERLKELNSTKDKLFSIIAHDLRSPFDNIIGLTELILDNSIDYEESKKYIKILNTNAKNTLILLDNLLNWAKSQTGQLSYKPEKLLLSNVIKEIIALNILHADNKSIAINYSPSEEIIVFADENMLRTVLRNLISNAIKFTNINGTINILTTLKGNFAEVTISDNGIGMNENKRKLLFKIISNQNGSGLGLVLCKEFVQKNKGEIVVESKEGKGSTFKFTLPLNPTE